MEKRFDTELLQAWGELFSIVDFDLFCTFTYSESVWSTEKVARDFKRTHYLASAKAAGLSKNNKSHRKRHRLEQLQPYILAIEPHRSGTLHAHALLGGSGIPGEHATSILTPQLLRETWKDNIRHAGFTSITPVRKNDSARAYMVKTSRYCAKNPDAYLDWYGLGNRTISLPETSRQRS